jgi:hypothetical protein
MRHPPLNLRDLLWLVALLGIGSLWWVDHLEQLRIRDDEAKKALQRLDESYRWKARADRIEQYVSKDLEIKIGSDGLGFLFRPESINRLLKRHEWRFEDGKAIPPPNWPVP